MKPQDANVTLVEKPSKPPYKNTGATPQTKQMIIKMSLNGNSIRDISRVPCISQNTVMSVLKKQKNSKPT
ncbi:MAG: IS1-like element transposase [Candidatus Bathyarchaeota archaeon]|nr:IS1-like element transposase [Candidatus Termiticorpusculum sp.]